MCLPRLRSLAKVKRFIAPKRCICLFWAVEESNVPKNVPSGCDDWKQSWQDERGAEFRLVPPFTRSAKPTAKQRIDYLLQFGAFLVPTLATLGRLVGERLAVHSLRPSIHLRESVST